MTPVRIGGALGLTTTPALSDITRNGRAAGTRGGMSYRGRATLFNVTLR